MGEEGKGVRELVGWRGEELSDVRPRCCPSKQLSWGFAVWACTVGLHNGFAVGGIGCIYESF
jgi:hypothetical protein